MLSIWKHSRPYFEAVWEVRDWGMESKDRELWPVEKEGVLEDKDLGLSWSSAIDEEVFLL